MANVQNWGGDPTVLGWTTFVLYLIAGVLSFRAARAFQSRDPAAVRRIWKLLGGMLIAFGINKQLDLQTLMIEIARQLALKEHVYAYRRALQAVFFLGIIVLLVTAILRGSVKVRMFARQFPLATMGCALVATYILIRAASTDHVGELLGFDLDQIPLLWLLEVGGLVMVIAQTVGRHEGRSKAG